MCVLDVRIRNSILGWVRRKVERNGEKREKVTCTYIPFHLDYCLKVVFCVVL